MAIKIQIKHTEDVYKRQAYDIGFGGLDHVIASGKGIKKKDLAGIAMSYGYVYVAQIAMGADYNQCLKAFHEAESYKGPSIIIAYAPCINHGIKSGMSSAMSEEKKAVAAGYWHLFRFCLLYTSNFYV